jgi:hypothetical protein
MVTASSWRSISVADIGKPFPGQQGYVPIA